MNKNKLQIQGRIRIFKSGILGHFQMYFCYQWRFRIFCSLLLHVWLLIFPFY